MTTKDEATRIIDDAGRCADYYENAPGHAGPDTMIDLYRTIARLAHIVERQQDQLDHLMPDKSSDV